jgi:DNA-binding beta-propeller fold protein YncE
LFILKGDGATIETVTLPPGTGPHIVTFSPSGTFAYVAGMESGKLLVLRADTRQVVSALDLGHAGTHQAKPAPGGSLLLVAQAHSSNLIKVAVNETAETWDVVGKRLSFAAQGKRPICTVFRDDGQRAYVSISPTASQ